jgi:hypothetical protein
MKTTLNTAQSKKQQAEEIVMMICGRVHSGIGLDEVINHVSKLEGFDDEKMKICFELASLVKPLLNSSSLSSLNIFDAFIKKDVDDLYLNLAIQEAHHSAISIKLQHKLNPTKKSESEVHAALAVFSAMHVSDCYNNLLACSSSVWNAWDELDLDTIESKQFGIILEVFLKVL